MAHGRGTAPTSRAAHTLVGFVLALVLAALVFAGAVWLDGRHGANQAGQDGQSSQTGQNSQPDSTDRTDPQPMNREETPEPDMSPEARASRAVEAMSLEERIGQLVMAPLFAGTDPSALNEAITTRHVGSVLIIGNWRTGVAGVKTATDALQAMAPSGNQLIVATDQEGGQVQHLKGTGFDTMPSAVAQGRMAADQLRGAAATWGSQLKSAGVNVDLAPVTGTVRGQRAANAPIGALNRDFGLDAAGNAAHASAFVQGMRDAGVETSIKHYPGLGAVTGNTDFTANGILDTTTTLDGAEIDAFHTVIADSSPAMVMMSLATYQAIDPSSPAAFSSTIIDGELRGQQKFEGVVISDSLSAAALGSTPTDQLGVRLIEAGGDLACIGQVDYVTPILDGLNARAAKDPAFAQKVTRSAERVMTLKYRMGLAS